MRRTSLSVALVPVALLILGACGGGDDPGAASGDPTSLAASLVPVTSTADPTADEATTSTTAGSLTTASSATTARPTTTQGPTSTGSAATLRPTTTVFAGAPCDLDLIVEQTQSIVAGVSTNSLRCAEDWASWAGEPDDVAAMDGYFAVAQWNGASWELRNLGTAGICGDGGVPEPLWRALDCVE